jgi:hypothetical protein
MGLEFDRVGAGIGNRVDEGVRHAERTVMRLRYFADDQGWAAFANGTSGDFED